MSKLFQKIKSGINSAARDVSSSVNSGVKFFTKGGAGHNIFRKIANTVQQQRPLTDMISNSLSRMAPGLAAYSPPLAALALSASSAIPRLSHGLENESRRIQQTYKKSKPNPDTGLERPPQTEAISDSTMFV